MSGRSSPPQNRSLTAVRKARCCFCLGRPPRQKPRPPAKSRRSLSVSACRRRLSRSTTFLKTARICRFCPNGETDFESIHTLDLDTLRACFNTLLAAGEAAFPIVRFHFRRPCGRGAPRKSGTRHGFDRGGYPRLKSADYGKLRARRLPAPLYQSELRL